MSFILMTETERGFDRGDFVDCHGASCSIQKSSVATEDMIWLGRNEYEGHLGDGPACCRMHLDRERAEALIVLLRRFVETGELTP